MHFLSMAAGGKQVNHHLFGLMQTCNVCKPPGPRVSEILLEVIVPWTFKHLPSWVVVEENSDAVLESGSQAYLDI